MESRIADRLYNPTITIIIHSHRGRKLKRSGDLRDHTSPSLNKYGVIYGGDARFSYAGVELWTRRFRKFMTVKFGYIGSLGTEFSMYSKFDN